MSIKFTLEARDKHMSLCVSGGQVLVLCFILTMHCISILILELLPSAFFVMEGQQVSNWQTYAHMHMHIIISVVFTVYQDMDIARYDLVKQISWV